MPATSYTDDDRRKVLELAKRGFSSAEIADRIGIRAYTVRRISRAGKLTLAKKPRSTAALDNWEPAGPEPTSAEIAEACDLLRQRRDLESIDDLSDRWTVPVVRVHTAIPADD